MYVLKSAITDFSREYIEINCMLLKLKSKFDTHTWYMAWHVSTPGCHHGFSWIELLTFPFEISVIFVLTFIIASVYAETVYQKLTDKLYCLQLTLHNMMGIEVILLSPLKKINMATTLVLKLPAKLPIMCYMVRFETPLVIESSYPLKIWKDYHYHFL